MAGNEPPGTGVSAVVEGRAQGVDGEPAGDVGGAGVAQAVQEEEVVDHAGHADGGHVHTGLAQLVGVLLALVAQDVGLVGDDQGGGQALEPLRGGLEREAYTSVR